MAEALNRAYGHDLTVDSSGCITFSASTWCHNLQYGIVVTML
jgi:hypothetical protein